MSGGAYVAKKHRGIYRVSKLDNGATLHIEAPGVLINVRARLNDGVHEVTHVSVTADGDRYKGNSEWWLALEGAANLSDAGFGGRFINAPRAEVNPAPDEACQA